MKWIIAHYSHFTSLETLRRMILSKATQLVSVGGNWSVHFDPGPGCLSGAVNMYQWLSRHRRMPCPQLPQWQSVAGSPHTEIDYDDVGNSSEMVKCCQLGYKLTQPGKSVTWGPNSWVLLTWCGHVSLWELELCHEVKAGLRSREGTRITAAESFHSVGYQQAS